MILIKWIVVFLVSVCPFLAIAAEFYREPDKKTTTFSETSKADTKNSFTVTGKDQPKPSLKTQNLHISGNWEKRLKDAGPGGGIDGGGGNSNGKGQLLDESTQSGPPLNKKFLKEITLKYLASRISQLDSQLDGFSVWLFQGLDQKIIWALDKKPFDKDVCRNYKFHEESQSLDACQSMTRMHFRESWYQSADQVQIAKMTVHELVRYHVIRLAKLKTLSRDLQDEIVAEITRSILNTALSAEFLYQQLLDYGLLLEETPLRIQRINEITALINIVRTNLDLLHDTLKFCKHEKYFKDAEELYFKSGGIILRAQELCESNLGIGSEDPVGTCPAIQSDYLAQLWLDKCRK